MVRAVSDNRANLPASKLRWYQFKLGTLLVFTTGVALVLGVALSSPYMTIIVPFLAGSIAGAILGDHQLRRMFFYGALGGTVGFWLGIAFMPIAHPVEISTFPANEAMDRRFYLYLGMCSSLAFLYLGGIVALVVWMLQFVVGVLVHKAEGRSLQAEQPSQRQDEP